MNTGIEGRKVFVPMSKVVSMAEKKRKTSRRFSRRRFAAAGFVNGIKRPFLLFSGLASMTYALCVLAPDTQDSSEQQSTQSKAKNSTDTVEDIFFHHFVY